MSTNYRVTSLGDRRIAVAGSGLVWIKADDLAEVLATLDTLTTTSPIAMSGTTAETLTLADTLTPDSIVTDAISEVLGLADTLIATVDVSVQLAEAVVITDTQVGGIVFSSTLLDELTLDDFLTSPDSLGAVPTSPSLNLPAAWMTEVRLTGRTERPF